MDKQSKIFAKVEFEGLENFKKNSADSKPKVKTTCTGKTSVKVEILKS